MPKPGIAKYSANPRIRALAGLRRHSNGRPKRTLTQIIDGFWMKVGATLATTPPADVCWPWIGATRKGYGVFMFGTAQPAHRMAWFFTWGPIPTGAYVCHRCDNPPCVNPAHLFLGTQADNMEDMKRKGRSRKPVP